MSPCYSLTRLPEEQLENVWLQRGNSLLNPTGPSKTTQKGKTRRWDLLHRIGWEMRRKFPVKRLSLF